MEEQTKDELLEQTSLAVEQIQKQFVQGGNAIKDCQEIFFLCQCVNNILYHGLKEGLISWAVEPTIWPLLEKITCGKDIEELIMLPLQTDREKCSAWIRMAVNENLLGSYIATINQDQSLLNNHYYEYAFLRDPVMANTVVSILNYGIANFDFQISISEAYPSNEYDISTKSTNVVPEHQKSYDAFGTTKENGHQSPKMMTPGPITRQESCSKKKRRKKKKIHTVVIADQTDCVEENTENLNNDSSKEKNNDLLKKEDSCLHIHENDKLLKNRDDTQTLKEKKSSLSTIDQPDVSTVSDAGDPLTKTANTSEGQRKTDQSDTSTVSDAADSLTKTANESEGQRKTDESDVSTLSDAGGPLTKTTNESESQRKTDQSDVSTLSDARDQLAKTANEGEDKRIIDQLDVSTLSDVKDQLAKTANEGEDKRTTDQSDGTEETKNEVPDFLSNPLDQYLQLNKQNPETKESELDSLGRIVERPNSAQEFSANDFLLDETEPQTDTTCDSNQSKENVLEDVSKNSSEDTSSDTTVDITDTSTVKKDSDFTNFQKKSGTHDSGNSSLLKSAKEGESQSSNGLIDTNENFAQTTDDENLSSSLKSQSRFPLRKSQDNNKGLSMTATSRDKFSDKAPVNSPQSEPSRKISWGRASKTSGTGVLSTSQYDYRVRKLENPEFVSSSYGSSSALSDYTDDDLNFIPGIHRMPSRSYSSSFERKSTTDNSLSFDENGLPMFTSSHYTESSSSHPSSVDENGGSKFTEASNGCDMFEDLLNVDEEHFSRPDNFAGLTTSEELEMAIEHYKKMIQIRKEKSQQRDDLVEKLVKLRLRLQQEKEGVPAEDPNYRKILSHKFSKSENTSGSKFFCDQCGKNIWTMWQSLFTCEDCGYHSHRKCLERIERSCPNINLSSVSYILEICPDSGLDAQQYRCAECRKEIAFSKDNVAEAKICDYSGYYFCGNCHWGDKISIPARAIRNWDFTQYKVCRKTKQLLALMKSRPILDIQQLNPMLYGYVEELREVGKFREDILIMKKYFLTCREALESKLLIQLKKRQHFVDSASTYSFQDLIDINNDVLLPEISKVHALFLAHIKVDCELCRARGFICEVCKDSSDVIFAFDPHAVKCENCSSVFHKMCFKPERCPKCERKKKMAEQTKS